MFEQKFSNELRFYTKEVEHWKGELTVTREKLAKAEEELNRLKVWSIRGRVTVLASQTDAVF
jgi:hypothetical protein